MTNRLFQTALQAAKEIRTQTNIGRGATSVGSVAVELAVAPADAFLICTDGAWEHLQEGEMETELARASSPEGWVEELGARVARAAPQGNDNYSLVGVWVDDDVAAAHPADDEVTVIRV